MLQFSIVGLKTKELYLPTRIQKVIIDPAKHLETIESLSEKNGKVNNDLLKCEYNIIIQVFLNFSAVPVYVYRDMDVIKSGGIELCGLKTSLAPRRQQSQAAPKLENYTFVPYMENKVIKHVLLLC